MAAEPTEEAISSFISFTSSTREQAINLLKANDLNSNKAINAYFEAPTIGPQPEAPSYPSAHNVPSFKVEHSDPVPGTSLVAPPSRPPSRISTKGSNRVTEHKEAVDASAQGSSAGTDQKLSLVEREEHELQQAVAMSLSQNLGQQETGVTSTSQPKFGPATQDYYDEGDWSMTLFNSTAREIVISPDPKDRKRVDNQPAFLRPSPDNAYLGGLLTILHSIPLAREALLLRNKVLFNYGHDSQWWNGQPINLPKIVTIHDGFEDSDWDDILHETQRLVAFLDSTTRAFGSVDALVALRTMSGYESVGNIGKFLEKWQEAAVRADPGNQLAAIFSSRALRRPLAEYDEPIDREFFALETFVEPIHGQTLYDVLDNLMWADRPGEDLDDVWLEHVAETLTIKLESSDSSTPVDVKIPPVFYPDRYLAECRELARDFRLRKLQFYEEIANIDLLINRFTVPKSQSHGGLTSREMLEKAADAVPVLLRDVRFAPSAVNMDARQLESQLRAMASKIERKLKELEARKANIVEALRNHSKLFTEPSSSPTDPPTHRYMLRGVCTEPHITYVLRRVLPNESTAGGAWQWWRISFSTDDAKTQEAEKNAQQSNESGPAAPRNADVIGYTTRKVREIEVLRAAREESRGVLLVYASENAMNIQEGPLPPQLQGFVDLDNKCFEDESQDKVVALPSVGEENPNWKAYENTSWEDYAPGSYPNPTMRGPGQQNVNVFDYEVSSFDDDKPAQEMQEKGGPSLLSQSSTSQPQTSMDTSWDEVDDSSGVTSDAKQGA